MSTHVLCSQSDESWTQHDAPAKHREFVLRQMHRLRQAEACLRYASLLEGPGTDGIERSVEWSGLPPSRLEYIKIDKINLAIVIEIDTDVIVGVAGRCCERVDEE